LIRVRFCPLWCVWWIVNSVIYTNDIEAGMHFHRDLLGFGETFRTPIEGVPEHVELRQNGFTIRLGTVEAPRRVHGVDAVAKRS
jgi:lactoylglutathione lyase